jgi:flagellin
MSVINTNSKSIIAQNSLAVNNRAMSKTMEQLSTGKRINSASDDAAGLAIGSKMTAQIKGLNQAVRNANDGISMLQTAEGAMIEQTNMMQRMRELAVQSANDTNTDDDREAMDLEFQELKSEINRIGNNTQWNSMNILDKSFDEGSGNFKFQVGANANQTISRVIGDFRTEGSSDGVATMTTTTGATSTAEQVQTLTLTGTYAENDVISLNVGGVSIQHTVTAANVAGAAAVNITSIGASLTAALQAAGVNNVGDDTQKSSTGITVAATATGLTLTAGADNTPFEASARAGGDLGNINGSTIDTLDAANSSISALDLSLKTINNARAEMGSTINRLTYAADNLTNVSQNTSASRSQILDTDYAQTTTELARTQIISQAATAMLAQANQSPQSVLSLLR